MTDDELLINLFYKKFIYSFNELYKKAKNAHPSITKAYVRDWFNRQQTIQMSNKPVGKKEFLPIYSETPYSFQIDLTFFPRYKKQNKGFEVLFTAININTRFAYAYACKTKDMDTILELLKKMESKTIINSITCDEGSEFKNKEFQEFCDKEEIQLFFVKADGHKLGIINRFHRTIKEKITQYFNSSDSVVWTNVLDDIIYNYNHSVNRGIGIEPYKVNSFIENEIIQHNKEKTDIIRSNDTIINIGDKCRLKIDISMFDDKMKPKYSNRIYEVVKVTKNSVIVKDSKNNELKVKKSNIKIITDVENVKELKELDNANYIHKVNRNIKKAGVQVENIVDGPRIRKKKTILDL
jgi:ribosomal protein L21E